MDDEDFPALFRSADAASNKYQSIFLCLVGGEYVLLIIASVLSMQLFGGKNNYLAFAAVLLIAIVMLLTRSLTKPQQDWYRCRALAESIKTITWRYMMHAEPFDEGKNLARQQFRDQLHELFNVNRTSAEKIDERWSDEDQITAAMESIYSLSVADRIAIYLDGRIKNQRRWYDQKARWNRSRAIFWLTLGACAYIVAIALSMVRVRFPEWQFWPIDPILVIATSIIGWTQIKRYSELTTAYKLTAQEIGLISPKLNGVDTEIELSKFVNEAEQAFSREHTMWTARQTS